MSVSSDYLQSMLLGYLLTVAVETPVLLVGLSRRHAVRARLFAGVWLSACTYPVVWLVLPPLFPERPLYLLVAETFAPVAECALFWLAFVRGRSPDRPKDIVDEEPDRLEGGHQQVIRSSRATIRDMAAIVVANLASFGVGELVYAVGWTP